MIGQLKSIFECWMILRFYAKCKTAINDFTLRCGFKQSGKSKWTFAYIKLLSELKLSPLLKETLKEGLGQYNSLCDKIERLNDKLNELSHNETYEFSVSKLRCF